MRGMSSDRGAIAVLTAIVATVLFGFGALVIDVGMLYAERRELQNGADAAALAVAQRCGSDGCAGVSGAAIESDTQRYADGAAVDDAENLVLCSDLQQLSPCTPDVTDLPEGTKGYVQALTRTGDATGTSLVPAVLGRVVDSDYDGQTVSATALAAWGVPARMRSLPLTFSRCEFNALTDNRTTFAPAPPYPNGKTYPVGWQEDLVFFKRPVNSAWPAPIDPSDPVCTGLHTKGPGADAPGGFGWLPVTDDECEVTTTAGEPIGGNPGVGVPQPCRTELVDEIGHVVALPVYRFTNDLGGSNVSYEIDGYAAFLITGYRIRGNGVFLEKRSFVTNKFCTDGIPKDWPNAGSMDCISGYFVSGVVRGRGAIGPGEDLGARVVQLLR